MRGHLSQAPVTFHWRQLVVTGALALSSGCSAVAPGFPFIATQQRARPPHMRHAEPNQAPVARQSAPPMPADWNRVPTRHSRSQTETHSASLPVTADIPPASSLFGPHIVAAYAQTDIPPFEPFPIQQAGLAVPRAPAAVPGLYESPEPAHEASHHASDALPQHELDLQTALELVAGQNPQVAFANQRIAEAQARLDAAEVLWAPSIRVGMSLHRHEGNLQASNGVIADVNRSSVQAGLGARAVGAGTTPTPGISAEFHLSDAIFQPLIAERNLSASNFGSWVAYNDQLLRAAEAYLELQRAHRSQAIAEDTQRAAAELARLTAAFASSGQGAQADADRSATELAIRRNDAARAEESIAVASARLAEVLHLDAPIRVVPRETQLVPIELVSIAPGVQQLVATGLSSRPELSESRELVAAACERLQRETYSPLVPSVLLGLSYGGFGGGLGDTLDNFDDRLDFDLAAVWEVRNLGWGETAARATAQARIEQARYRDIQLMDQVSREVISAHAQVSSRHHQIATARQAVTTAEQAYARDRQRINQGQGLPLESLQSIQALDRARREHLRAIVDFNTAQFRLHHALGWPGDAR